MQRTEMQINTKPEKSMRTAYEWLGFEKPSGVDDAHWAELTPKQKAVIAHRLMCISEYRKGMRGESK